MSAATEASQPALDTSSPRRRRFPALTGWETALASFASLSLPLLLLSPAWAEETRCTELGSQCTCSEPLDNLDVYTTDGWHNPSDSTTKQCNRGNALNIKVAGNPQDARGVAGSSVGLQQLTGVLQITRTMAAPTGLFDNVSRNMTGGTFCARYYVRYDSRTWTPSILNAINNQNHNDMKSARWIGSGNPNPQLQCVWSGRGASPDSPPGTCSHAGAGPFGTRISGDPIRFNGSWQADNGGFGVADCLDTWCRHEICFDHNSRGGADANKILYRQRAYRVSDGTLFSFPDTLSLGSSASAYNCGTSDNSCRFQAFDTPDWNQSPDFSPAPDGAIAWYSHVMGALLPTADENFWIGPAYEIEGGGSSGPPPAAPEPPVILP